MNDQTSRVAGQRQIVRGACDVLDTPGPGKHDQVGACARPYPSFGYQDEETTMFERGKKDPGKGGDDALSSQNTSSGWDSPSAGSGSPVPKTDRRDVAVIGRSIRINGDLQGDEDLRIEGDVTGTVELKNNTLTIGAEGKIRADVYAKSVTVDGLVEGDLYGSERVNIRKNAQVRGNITAPRVSLEDGARFKGSIEMDTEAVSSALGIGRGPASGSDASATLTPVSATSGSVSTSTGPGPAAKPQSASGK